MWQTEQLNGSLIRGMFKKSPISTVPVAPRVQRLQQRLRQTPIYSFRDGCERLIHRLEKRLSAPAYGGHAVQICKRSPLRSFTPQSKGWLLDVEGHDSPIECDQLILTQSPVHMATLLKDSSAALSTLDADVSTQLGTLGRAMSQIESASLWIVQLAWNRTLFPPEHRAFGFLVPRPPPDRISPLRCLGITFDSETFPLHNRGVSSTRLTVMLGGDRRPDLCGLHDHEIKSIALQDARIALGHMCPELRYLRPTWIDSHLHRNCIAQYRVGHHFTVSDIERNLLRLNESLRLRTESSSPRLHMIGTGLYGVSINDCIARAHQLAVDISNAKAD